MQKIKPIQASYQYYNHFLPHTLSMKKACPSQKQQEQPDLQTCLNNSFQLFADTMMSKFENLTSKIVGKGPSSAKAKEKRLRKCRQSDNDVKASLKPSSDSESELEEQVRQRKKTTKN